MNITIAGATGFVGQMLIEQLKQNFQHNIRALSRSKEGIQNNIEWMKCDLFSLSDCQKALAGADVAVYLVHSMEATARLDQGSFEDYDLILADNFVRACELNKVKKIIYLGGLIPSESQELSSHLQSRLEVENTLSSKSVPCITFRAGMIIEKMGSSFDLFVRIVDLMPVIPLPPWSDLKTEIVDGLDVVRAIQAEIESEVHETKTYDLGNGNPMSYAELIKDVARARRKEIFFFKIPCLSFYLFKVFLFMTTNAPWNFISPLVGSLKHEIKSRTNSRYNKIKWTAIEETLSRVVASKALNVQPKLFLRNKEILRQKKVRSVQRFKKDKRLHADVISFAYLHWLPKFFKPFLFVRKQNQMVYFQFWGLSQPLLVLEHVYQRSQKDRQIYMIVGGLLYCPSLNSRLEFRDVLGGEYLMAAIHEFTPRLPWWIYRSTQAPIHLFVMKKFGDWILNYRNKK